MITKTEQRIIAAAASTFIGTPVDTDRHIPRVVNILAMTDAANVAELRLALKILESRITGILLTRRWEKFSTATAERQERRVAALARSRFALLRTIYIAVHRLSHGAYYSDPQHYADVGYPGPLESSRQDAPEHS